MTTKKQTNKITIMSIVIIMILSIIFGYSTNLAYTYKYTMLNDGTYCVTDYRGFSNNIVIPSKHFGKPVTEIAVAMFNDNKSIKSVTIPDTIETLGFRAFDGCTNLKSVRLSKNITTIDFATFRGCTNLTDIEISNNITDIGQWAFAGCTNLTDIDIPKSVENIGAKAFIGTSWIENQDEPLIINDVLISYGDIVGNELIIPDGVKVIADGSYNYADVFNRDYYDDETHDYINNTVTKIVIPDTVTYIGNSAFSNFTNLKEVTIPDSVTHIGNNVFNGCESLENIELSTNITHIGSGAFEDTPWIESFTEPVIINNILVYYPNASGVVEIPYGVTTINDIFSWEIANNITGVIIPNTVTCIGEYAFSNCNIQNIEIPNSVTYIGRNAFDLCDLKQITIPESVEYIGQDAFFCNYSLEEVNILSRDTKVNYLTFLCASDKLKVYCGIGDNQIKLKVQTDIRVI